MVVSSDSSPKLQSKAAQRREREAEERAEAAALEAARASKASAAPLAEARRLRAQLESAHAEADMLRSRLAQVDRERCPTRVGSRLASSGLGAELEDADDARLRQLETQVRLCAFCDVGTLERDACSGSQVASRGLPGTPSAALR